MYISRNWCDECFFQNTVFYHFFFLFLSLRAIATLDNQIMGRSWNANGNKLCASKHINEGIGMVYNMYIFVYISIHFFCFFFILFHIFGKEEENKHEIVCRYERCENILFVWKAEKWKKEKINREMYSLVAHWKNGGRMYKQ